MRVIPLLLALSSIAHAAPDPSLARPRWEAGGGDATVLFLVYDAPEGVEGKPQGPFPAGVHVERFPISDPICGGLLNSAAAERAPSKLLTAVRKARSCTRVAVLVRDPADLGYLRDAVASVTQVAGTRAAAILDGMAARWWSVGDWRERVGLAAHPDLTTQVSLEVSPEAGSDRHWLHTRGLLKFGRPDFGARGLTKPELKTFSAAIDLLIREEVKGAVLRDGQAVNAPGLPAGVTLKLRGDANDEDFGNRYFELVRPR